MNDDNSSSSRGVTWWGWEYTAADPLDRSRNTQLPGRETALKTGA